MRRWLTAWTVLLLLAGCVSNSRRGDAPEVDRAAVAAFVRNYRTDPRPGRIDELLLTADRNMTFMVNNPHRVTVEGFLYLVVRQNPDRIEDWWAVIRGLRFGTRLAYIRALWMADNPAATELLDRIETRNVDNLARTVRTYRGRPRPDLTAAPIVEPYDLYLLWGAWYATGDRAYLDRIVRALPREDARGEAATLAVWETAVDTLTVAAGRDPEIAAALRESDRRVARDILAAAAAGLEAAPTLFAQPRADWLRNAARPR